MLHARTFAVANGFVLLLIYHHVIASHVSYARCFITFAHTVVAP